jgi:hypothetical protein
MSVTVDSCEEAGQEGAPVAKTAAKIVAPSRGPENAVAAAES